MSNNCTELEKASALFSELSPENQTRVLDVMTTLNELRSITPKDSVLDKMIQVAVEQNLSIEDIQAVLEYRLAKLREGEQE